MRHGAHVSQHMLQPVVLPCMTPSQNDACSAWFAAQDEDWIKLLGDVDARLAARGCPPLAPRERPVAIAQLLSATSSRGVDTAMAGALEAVLRFRAARGGR